MNKHMDRKRKYRNWQTEKVGITCLNRWQTDGQKEKERKRDRQMNGLTEEKTHRQTDKCGITCINGWQTDKEREKDRKKDRQIEGQTNEKTDRQMWHNVRKGMAYGFHVLTCDLKKCNMHSWNSHTAVLHHGLLNGCKLSVFKNEMWIILYIRMV